ncbi:hypothetical protein WKS98_08385 [Lagierella sp. ICN-221743]
MKLILDFRYQCEMEVTKEEFDNMKDNLKKDRFIPDLNKEINWMLLIDDGRSEWGEVVDFDYEIEED